MFSNFSPLITDINDFEDDKEEIEEGMFGNTYVVTQSDTQIKFTIKYLSNVLLSKEDFFTFFRDNIAPLQYPCLLTPSYVWFGLGDKHTHSIFSVYRPYKSLQQIITKEMQGEIISGYNLAQKYLILYGISHFLDLFHSDKNIHGGLKLNNIIIDNNFSPIIVDPCLYKISSFSNSYKAINYLVSLPPEALKKQQLTQASDIYSFGIIILQVLTQQINVFPNLSEDEIEKKILSNTVPTIIESSPIPKSILDILLRCFSSKPEERSSASEIKSVLQAYLIELGVDKTKISNFCGSLLHAKMKQDDPKIYEIKKKADEGDLTSIYLYGHHLYNGEGCYKNIPRGMDYIRFAARQKLAAAKNYYSIVRRDDRQKNNRKSQTNYDDDSTQKTHLKDDPFFLEKEFEIDGIIKDVKNNIKKQNILDFDAEKLLKYNFILTPDAAKRLTQLSHYIDTGIPVILEGPTGTSKTFSTQIICEYLGRKLIRFNLSSETKPNDLLGKYDGDSKSWAGIKMHEGPFIEAFKNGYTLLLDEINLASINCLQFIEDTLDSKVISIEISGMSLKEIKMHPDFRLIATQNPNKGFFAQKRQVLGEKFLSRFKVIKFPEFTKEELLQIAEGLADKFGYKDENNSKIIIEHLVDFHIKWSKSADIAEDIQCFTVREISATVKALSKHKSIYDTIMTIYGSRYQKEKKDKIKKIICDDPVFKSSPYFKPDNFIIPADFTCFHSKSFKEALKSIIFSFRNHRHVILAAQEGTGITQIARWVAKWHNGRKCTKEFFCICTEETKCSDLIGKHKPSKQLNESDNDENGELIRWENGFLTTAVIKGKCCVLDNLDEAPATVTERLNGLLDQKFDEGDDFQNPVFEIPENPKENKVEISEKFRLLCTCKLDNINQMSPAFINRFDVIVLENQISDEDDIKELVENLMEQAHFILFSNQKDINKGFSDDTSSDETDSNDTDSDDTSSDGTDSDDTDSDDTGSDDESLKHDSQSSFDVPKYKPNQEIIKLIINKIDSSKITMFQLSQLCRAVTKYYNYFPNEITPENIVDFSIKLLNKNQDFEISPEIEDFLLSKLKKSSESNDSKFFFRKSKKLCSFIAKLFAASLINLPVCVYGPTGVGKTASAREFSRIRPIESNEPFQMHSYHAGTKPIHFYGTTTIKNENINFINGTLTTAMTNGQNFIADELNLAPTSTLKSLAPSLEPINNQRIYISGVENPILIHKDFFFIACQNELGTIGRNTFPATIASRFRYFYYPEQETDEISLICADIANSLYKDDKYRSFSDDDAQNVGRYMVELNKLNKKIIPKWSLRDITKIFQRVHYQDKNRLDFKNITLCHNLLFYTLSPISNEDIDEVFKDVNDLLTKIFPSVGNQLEECYKANPTIEGKFLMKGKSGILFNSFENIDPNLHSLLNGMFQILLSNPTEPILLMGPSGFKTFLAQQFLKDAKIITLNQESMLSQLLGSSAFLSKLEAKIFYIDTICKICHIYDHKYISEFKEKVMNKETKDNFLSEFKESDIYRDLPDSFKNVVHHLLEKLNDENRTKSNNRFLSKLELEFRPGLFLSALLERKSLILKNLSNLPTIVLERFNELFSGMHHLTLNEDIHNTFTDENCKELTGMSSNFRVLATCPPNSVTKLSEAVLSRFSVIWIPSYKPDEQEIVLRSYIKIKDLSFDESFIPILTKFSENMSKYFNKSFTFPQIINSVEMCSRLNNNSSKNSNNGMIDYNNLKKNLGIILYRLGFGLIEKRPQSILEYNHIFDFDEENSKSSDKALITEKIVSSMPKNPLRIEKVNEFNGVKSQISEHFINSPEASKSPTELAFTPMFSEMLDILHLGLSINIPVIFEGMPGQGKQTAINYIAQILGYNVINIIISQSTKVEDLLGKITIKHDKANGFHVFFIETKLVKALKSDNESSNSIIVFHNINNASSAVIELLSSIFDQHQKDLLLPDGSTISKRQLNIVCIFNPQNGIYNRDKLPSSLMFSSIYHIVNTPTDNDIKKVIESTFKDTKFTKDAQIFYDRFLKIKNYAIDVNALSLTLNDIGKYKTFREVTFGKFDDDTISLMIFAYRFLHQDYIDMVREKIGLVEMKFIPEFVYNKEKKTLFIKVSKKSKDGISLDFKGNESDIESITNDISGLTLPQKHCLLFLACSVLSKQSCIIQGETASGKSFIVRLFAKMLGRKLNVYQMNSETNATILTGQSVLSNELSEDDINEINDAINSILQNVDVEYVKRYINQNVYKKEDEWTRETFTKLISKLQNLPNSSDIEEAIQKIKDAIQPAKRFKIEESSFTKAMMNGEWILIDGIESAPAEIAEKISSLCGVNPELDLLECGKDHFFTRKSLPDSKHIHDDFHLFVTYNPMSQVENKTLDSSFLNKCSLFTLPSIDSTLCYSAQVLLGKLLQYYPPEFSIEISKRMAVTHNFGKIESKRDRDSFAADLQFNGRTLIFIIKEFLHYAPNNQNDKFLTLFRPICDSIQFYYWNSFINPTKEPEFQKGMLDAFSKELDLSNFENLTYKDQNLKEKYKELLIDLRNIQLLASGILPKSNFLFDQFIQKCLLVQIIDVPFILHYIKDTVEIILDSNSNLDAEYSQLIIIGRIFNDILKGMKKIKDESNNLTLEEDHLLETKELNHPISRLRLLKKLTSIKSCFSTNIPRILFDADYINLMKTLIKLPQEKDANSFVDFISLLHSKPTFIPLIESRIPYDIFSKTPFEMIRYILPMFRKLYKSKITFHVIAFDEKFDFQFSKQSGFEPTYVFSEKKLLTLSKGSYIVLNKNFTKDNKLFYEHNLRYDDYKINYFFYNITDHLLQNQNERMICNKYYYEKEVSSQREDQKRQLSLILNNNEKEVSLIAKIWPFVYSFSDDTLESLTKYVRPLEAQTIKLLNKIYNSISKENIDVIDVFSQTFQENKFGDEQSYLWKIMNNQFSINNNWDIEQAKQISDKMNSEIVCLENVSKCIKDVYSFDPLIKLLNDENIKIKHLIQNIIQKDVDLSLKAKLDSIIDDLRGKRVIKEYETIKNQIIHQIYDSKQKLTENIIAKYQELIDDFLDSTSMFESDYKNNIMWPSYRELKNHKTSPRVKLFEHIIWFSRINQIVNNFSKKENGSFFSNILHLSLFKEMKPCVTKIVSHLFQIDQSNGNKIISNDLNMIKSSLNAYFLARLINDFLIDDINNLRSIFNDLEQRKLICEENVLYWIHSNANQNPLQFNLSLPSFSPNDLLQLFVRFDDNEKPMPGILLADFNDYYIKHQDTIRFVNNLKNEITQSSVPNDQSLLNYAKLIGINVCKYFIRTKLGNDYQKVKEEIDKYYYKNYSNPIFKATSLFLKLVEKLDSMNQVEFTFGDTVFLKKDWIQNKTFVDSYPSLVYWLCRNHRCASQLRDIFEKTEFSSNELPFWLFALRLMSSERCIEFECSFTTNESYNIREYINQTVREFISRRHAKSEPIGTKWLNVILSNVPPEISISNYRLLYQFILNIAVDNKSLPKELNEIKNRNIRSLIKNIFDLIFEDKFEQKFNLSIDSNEDCIKFLRDPNKLISEKIQSNFIELLNKFSKDNSYQIINLESNSHSKPKIEYSKQENKLELILDRSEDVKRLNCEVKLKFSDQFITSIIIDSIVTPFNFDFNVYDQKSKKYSNESTIYYPADCFPFDIKLHFRIDSYSFVKNLPGNIKIEHLPSDFIIQKFENITAHFVFNGNVEFDIVLTMQSISRSGYSNGPPCSFSVNICGQIKTIKVIFINGPELVVTNNKIYQNNNQKQNISGYNKNNRWEKVTPDMDLNEYTYLVSPVSYKIINQKQILYGHYCEIKNTNENIFMSIDNNGNTYTYKSMESTPITSKNILQRASQKIKNFFTGKKESITYFYPIYGVSENCWYPVFSSYPYLSWKELEFKKESINEAQNNIYIYRNNNHVNGIQHTSFVLLFNFLLNKSNIKIIGSIIELLPDSIKTDFNPLIDISNTILDREKDMIIILQHNIIRLFYIHFKKRYDQIKENRNYLSSSMISKSQIRSEMQQLYEVNNKKYSSAKTFYENSIKYKQIKKFEEDSLSIQLNPKPDQYGHNEAYKYTENFEIIPKTREDKPQIVSSDFKASQNSGVGKIEIELPQISIFEDKEKSDFTIQKLDDFYISCTKATRLLPIYVNNMITEGSSESESRAIKYFEDLLQLYKNLPAKDYSLISSSTNLFAQSFISMIDKFQKADVDFKNILPTNCCKSDEIAQDFLQYPDKDELILPPDEWKSFKQDFQCEEEDKQEEEEKKDEEDRKNIVIIDGGKNVKPEEEEDNKIKSKTEKKNVIVTSADNIIEKQVSHDQFDQKLPEFKEINGIERGINRMRSISPDSDLDFFNCDYQDVKPSSLDTNKKDFPIKKLLKLGSFLVSNFIKAAFEIEIPRSKSSVNILVDCSSFISDENKIFNMMIICALTQALDSLEIPYSAAVVADKNFKRVIKPFREPHSPKCLQRICECLLIKRYRTKLASSIQYAINNMIFKSNSNDDSEPKDERPYRSIFVFSDGLDEQLILSKKWKEKVLIGENLKYGLVFIKSSKLSEANSKFIEEEWDKFETEVNLDESERILKIASIKNIIDDNLSTKLVDLFKEIMERKGKSDIKQIIQNKESIDKLDKSENAKFDIDEKLSDISRFSEFINKDFKDSKEVFVSSTQTFKDLNLVFSKSNLSFYRNKLRKIANCTFCDDNVKKEFDEFVKSFVINRREINQAPLETIYKPNKDTRTSLSVSGTEIDIIALVLNLLNPVPNPMIYLELKGGLIRNYGVSVIVDPSVSCFDDISGPHSFQTIRVILSTLASLDLPCFDLIVAGNPNPTVICSEISTIHSLSLKSTLFNSLLALLQNPIHDVDLGSAIHTAFDLRRMRSTEYTSVFFVLTNGLYSNENREKIINNVNMCVHSGITVFGIGTGIYPKGIEKLFPQVVYSSNPMNVMKAAASFYGDAISSVATEMNPICFPKPTSKEMHSITKLLIDNEEKPIFKSLKEELECIPATLDAVSDMVNQEMNIGNEIDGFENPEGVGAELYSPNILKTQKILFVMLWDKSLNPKNEEIYIHPDYICKPSKEEAGCIESAVKVYGIELNEKEDIVQNYEDAINKITENSNGSCKYYAVWVFCGPPLPILPGKPSDPNLVGQFIEVLIKFWENGGSIVFWAEGEPLYYQVNLFLEKVQFKYEKDCPSGKTELRISGNHEGRQTLFGDETGNLDRKKTFNRSNLIFKKCERTKLSHNIGKIFEGITISYAPFDLEKIKPFKPFSRDSEGGISSLFYCANLETGTGDIVIDCGFTKCFTQMEKDGTFRYVQNIAGWTGRPEIHKIIDKTEPCDWRPKAVDFKIQKGVKWPDFQIQETDPKKLKTLWAIDSSGSVRNNSFYHKELKKIADEYNCKKEDDFWLWASSKKHINYDKFVSFYSNKEGSGGTNSSLIAEIAKESQCREHLIIVTDGEVSNRSIDKSDELMNKYKIKFKYVTTFIIGTRNLSVGAPYSRDCENVTYYISKNSPIEQVASLSAKDIAAIDGIDRIDTYQSFDSQYSNLYNAIQASTLGKQDNSILIEKIKSLKKRLKGKMTQQQTDDFNIKINPLELMVNGALRKTFTVSEIGAALKGT